MKVQRIANAIHQGVKLFICALAIAIIPAAGEASEASRFVGWYHILAPAQPKKEYLLIDTGTLLEIWNKYASSPLPEDLQKYKDEPTILAGFTNRDFLILCFEQTAVVADRYLSVGGGQGDQLDLYRRDDGSFDMATKQNGNVDRYLLASPAPNPSQLALQRGGFREEFYLGSKQKMHAARESIQLKPIVFK